MLALLPILIPLATAIVTLLVGDRRGMQRSVSVVGGAALLAASIALVVHVERDGVVAVQLGDWPAPFGISVVADLFGAAMVALSGITGFAVAVYSLASVDKGRERHGYHPLYHVLLMGVNGAFLTGDMFNLYVWFEVMLIASFVLLALGGERRQLEGALKYVTLNLVSSVFFLIAVAALYGLAGTLNMADLSQVLAARGPDALQRAVSMLFLISFGIKAAIFPLYFWLPASYHTPPVAITAIFAGLLTKVGVYALVRVFTLLFSGDSAFFASLILWLGAITMLSGVLGAAAQNDVRRILSFHIVSQIGYMIMGLGLFTAAGIAGTVFYVVHHIVVKTNLFLVAGILHRLQGTYSLSELGGLYGVRPALAVLFLVPALSLAGIPPLSGFWAKLALVRAGIEAQEYAVVAVAIVVSLLTLYSMMKIWNEAFWKPRPESTRLLEPATAQQHRSLGWLVAPAIALAAITVTIGLVTEPFAAYAQRTATQLIDRGEYVRAVLGEARADAAR